ncbi:MAG TPA: family 43 glycosylhydrolase [Blastococcus sp.]|nr:family 43 glycosylhydrolase [Blastococcus sp.]
MTVQRPVIPGFHPDPSICRVGDTYYLATSSFEYAPGVPIFRSTDLRSWELIGHALHEPSQLDVSKAGPSGGIFAPTLRHHDGRFWMITTNWSDDGGQLLVHAEDPAGPWSEPVRIPSAIGIDPDVAWDDDGTCLMSWTGPGLDGLPAGIRQAAIDPLTGEILGETRWLWAGTGGKFPEGPHLYRIGEWWYLLIAEGGTERGHAVTIARSRSPQGPFESNPGNPLITHRGTDEPVQNTGHADLVQRPDGSWAMVYHGVRARGSSPEWHVLGRETFADEVVWEDGWPVLTGHLEPAASADAVVRDEITGPALPPAWVAASRFPGEVAAWTDAGWQVRADGGEPVFLGRRQEHLHARVRARLDVDGTGGIAVRIDPAHAVELEVAGGSVRAIWAIGAVRHVLGERAVDGEPVLELRMEPAPGGGWDPRGPDRIAAGVVENGAFTELGAVDGRYLSTEVAGGMTGRVVGLTCREGAVLVRSFEYVGADDPAAVT